MRVYISADMEGIPGVVTREQLTVDGFEYQEACRWMTEVVNAAIRGATSEGATEFVVSDSHGNAQNIRLNDLEGNVSLVRSWPRPLGMMQGIETGSFECAYLIGYHAGVASVGGGLAHTLSSRAITRITLNGIDASEALISANSAGHFNVPVSMIVGDNAFVEETLHFLPHAEHVTTKEAHGLFSARCRKLADVLPEIEAASAAALKRRKECDPLVLGSPIEVELWFKSILVAEYASYLPIVKRTGAFSVKFQAKNALDLVPMLTFLFNYRPDAN